MFSEPQFEQIFEINGLTPIVKIRAFNPELKGGKIVLPVETTNEDGEIVTLGFTLNTQHLRDLLDALDYPDEISA